MRWMSRSPGVSRVDRLEEGEPLLVTVALGDAGDQLAFQVVQGGEQGQRAVADIIMRPGLDVADAERQAGLTTLECLALRFLVATQHQSLLRRIEIEPDHVPEFRLETLSLESLKVRERCGLMSLAAHTRWTLAFEMPVARAIVRQLHRPSVAGGVTAISTTMHTTWLRKDALRPRPGHRQDGQGGRSKTAEPSAPP